jgi:hypothetical protein
LCATAKARARAERNGIRTGPEVGGVPEEIPAISSISAIAEIKGNGAAFAYVPRLGGLNAHDGVELPAFQELAIAFDPGNFVTGRDSEPLADVEVAAAVFRPWIPAVLREVSGTIQRAVVEAMTVRITG